MSFAASAIEKLRSSGNKFKLLIPHTITKQLLLFAGERTCTDSSFFNGEIFLKLVLYFVKSTNAIGSRTNSPHKFEMLGISTLICKVNVMLIYNLSLDKSYRALYEFTMQSLDQVL